MSKATTPQCTMMLSPTDIQSNQRNRHTRRLLGFLLFATISLQHATATVLVTRGVQEASIIAATGQAIFSARRPEWCQLEQSESIVISHPQSIDQGDRYYGIGSLSLEAVTMTMDYINNSTLWSTNRGEKLFTFSKNLWRPFG